MVNRRAAEMFGYPQRDMIGMQIEQLVPTESRSSHGRMRHQYTAAPTERMMGVGRDLRGRQADGETFPVEIGLTPFEYHGEKLVAAAVVDITSRRMVEMQMEEAYSDLQQLTYGVSHDLRAPLRSISGFVQILKSCYSNNLDPDALELIDRTVNAVGDLQHHISQLLSHAAVDAQGGQFEDVDLDEVLERVMEFKESIHEDVRERVHWSGLHTVSGDRAMLIQLFQNLVGNALKYRHPERKPQIQVSSCLEGGKVIVRVADNGLGILADDFERIFQVFERAHGKQFQGSGIGLATCRRVVRRLGGDILLESSSEEGSVFRVTLKRGENRRDK